MKIRKLKKADGGVVGVVVAVLLIGLLVSIVSILQMVYVPKWMEEIEAEHMDVVANQFSQLKFAIDTQTANAQKDRPISTSITLGSKELPYLMSVRAFGNLEILSDSCVIEIDTAPDTYDLGIIKYSSANAYFIDESFIYEAGAVIVSQAQGNIMSIKPSMSVSYDPTSIPPQVSMIFNLVDIESRGDKESWSGYDTIPIQTEYADENDEDEVPDSYSGISYFRITSSYPNAWSYFLDGILKREGLISGTDYEVVVTNDVVTINFLNPGTISYDITVNTVYIDSQIGPGWVG